MICPYCSQTHSDEIIDCPTTGKKLKRACTYQLCSYYGEYLFPLEQDTCPCCGNSLVDTHNGRQFVDLGLSVKWATCNIGATSPEENGNLFRWGEATNADEGTRDSTPLLKYYAQKFGTLDHDDDAAHKSWGGSWRMPTKGDFEELIDPYNCDGEFTSINGVPGYKFISVKPGHEGNYIFLPSVFDSSIQYLSSSFDYPYWGPLVLYADIGYDNFSIIGSSDSMFLPIRAVCD